MTESTARTIGSWLVAANGFCIGSALAHGPLLGHWRTAALFGLVGSVTGYASRLAARMEALADARSLLAKLTSRMP
jgi:hypothetical protein